MSTVPYCSRCGAATTLLDGGLCARCRSQTAPTTLVDPQATVRQLSSAAPGTTEIVTYAPSHGADTSAATMHSYRVPASRLRLFCRTGLAWLPFLVFPVVSLVLYRLPVWAFATVVALCAALVLYNLVRPRRSLIDVVAGTWLVPA